MTVFDTLVKAKKCFTRNTGRDPSELHVSRAFFKNLIVAMHKAANIKKSPTKADLRMPTVVVGLPVLLRLDAHKDFQFLVV